MARKGLWKLILGIHGNAPITMSSMLGWVAAVMAMVSPSHPRPAVTHKTSSSVMGVRAPASTAGSIIVNYPLECTRVVS